MAWPKPEETVVLTVAGRNYKEWLTVQVKKELNGNPPFTCRFTCSEGLPIAKNFEVMQIRPGMKCSVTLAGHPAFSGTVMTRQVYYDANRHHIEIIAGVWPELMTSSVISQSGEWVDKTFQQIAQDVLSKFGYSLKIEGGPPPETKFPRASVHPGESPVDFLDTLARSLSSTTGNAVSITSDEVGNYVLSMGPKEGGGDSVTEAKDILIGREIVFNQSAASTAPAIAQGPGNDQKWGANVAHVPFAQQSMNNPFNQVSPGVIVSEIPTSEKQVLGNRATIESGWGKGDEITVTVTVYGWLRPSGGLWEIRQKVSVYSPMLIMYGDVLTAKSVIFTQDNNTGTRTTLVLCNELALGKGGVPGGIRS